MKTNPARHVRAALALAPTLRSLCSLAIAAFVSITVALAQQVPQSQPESPPNAQPPSGDEVIVLSPFEVAGRRDTSYGALNSNSITRFNMPLQETPVSAEFLTAELLRDVGTTTVEEALSAYGAGTGLVVATPDSDSMNNQPGDRYSVSQNGLRGLSGGFTRRNGFRASTTYTSTTIAFDIERIDIVKGPQSILSGESGPGGGVNTMSRMARFGIRRGSIQLRLDQYNSNQIMLDANLGGQNAAVRAVLIRDDQRFRRDILNAVTEGGYVQLAFKLPLRSILRLEGRWTQNERIGPRSNRDISFTSHDTRNNWGLGYMLATNQAGATNPYTGKPYGAGAIDNGNLSWENYNSWGGWAQMENIGTRLYTGVIETTWTPWLATQIGFMRDDSDSVYGSDGGDLMAPGFGNKIDPAKNFNANNPLPEWGVRSTLRVDKSATYRNAYRAVALITKNFWSDRIKTQTSMGYDIDRIGSGSTNYYYYETDDAGNLKRALRNSGADWYGRYAFNPYGNGYNGASNFNGVFWAVPNGPIRQAYEMRMGDKYVTVNGKRYILAEQNPRNPAWAFNNPADDPTGYTMAPNPLGLASLRYGPGSDVASSVGAGNNKSNYADTGKTWGTYINNVSKFWDERIILLSGWRYTSASTTTPNASATGTQPYYYTDYSHATYNIGILYRPVDWLSVYYNYGTAFEGSKGGNDAFGNPPLENLSHGWEVGLKFLSRDGRYSANLSYYSAFSENENFNMSSYNYANPTGLNGRVTGPGGDGNNWVNLDKKSNGMELLFTAEPVKGWSIRGSLSMQNGKILTQKEYNAAWNDEFYVDKSNKNLVVYSDGTPFMVPAPTDQAGLTYINGTSDHAPYNPAGGAPAMVQLTVDMMRDPNSPYYIYRSDPNVGSAATNTTNSSNGAIYNGSPLWRALKYTNKSGIRATTGRVGLPYASIPYLDAVLDTNDGNGVILVSRYGEPTVGQSLYTMKLNTAYEVQRGWLKGLRLGGSASMGFESFQLKRAINHGLGHGFVFAKRTYYYMQPVNSGPPPKGYMEVEEAYNAALDNTPTNGYRALAAGGGTSNRYLFLEPTPKLQVDLMLAYTVKLSKGLRWRTQLNIRNVFNTYIIALQPSTSTGFSREADINANLYGQPRMYVWTNSIEF